MDQKLKEFIQKKFEECFGEDFKPSDEMEEQAHHYKASWRRHVPVWVRRIRR